MFILIKYDYIFFHLVPHIFMGSIAPSYGIWFVFTSLVIVSQFLFLYTYFIVYTCVFNVLHIDKVNF